MHGIRGSFVAYGREMWYHIKLYQYVKSKERSYDHS